VKLAFIYPTYHGVKYEQSIDVVEENYGIYPPINIAYVAAIARYHNHEVFFIDACAEELSKPQVLKKLKKIKPEY